MAGVSLASIPVLGSGITLATLILAQKCTDYIIDNKLSPKSLDYWLAISLTAMAATGSAIGPLLIENKIHTLLKPPPPPTSLVNKTVIPESMPKELREVVDTAAESVVKINIGEGACSGSVVGVGFSGSHILTAAHCISQYYNPQSLKQFTITVTTSDGQSSQVIGVAPSQTGDTALLQLRTPLSVQPLGVATPEQTKFWLNQTKRIVAIGFPQYKIYNPPVNGQEIDNPNQEQRYAFWADKPAWKYPIDLSFLEHMISFTSFAPPGGTPIESVKMSRFSVETSAGAMSGAPVIPENQTSITAVYTLGPSTKSIQAMDFKLIGVDPVSQETKFCLINQNNTTEILPLKELLKMHFTGINYCKN